MKKNILLILVLGVLLTLAIRLSSFGTGKSDFLAYWSAAHLFVSGGNPYDQNEMRFVEQSVSADTINLGDIVINAWNPPWLILIFAPLGALHYLTAFSVWIFCNTVLIGLVLLLSWQMCTYAKDSRGILAIFVAGFLFGITISNLAIGQISVLVLVGMILSIWWLDRQKDLLAGAILILSIIKPQISFFFLLLLIIWVIKERRWKVFAGFGVTTFISLIVFWALDPGWVKDYVTLIRNLPYTSTYTSTIGSFIASIFNTRIFYFSGVVLVLLIKPILQILETDGWFTTLNIILLLSLPFSFYGFSFDQIVLLPSIVQIISWVWNRMVSRKYSAIIIGSLIIFYTIVLIMLSIHNLEYYWFFIVPILLFFIYIIPWRIVHKSKQITNNPVVK